MPEITNSIQHGRGRGLVSLDLSGVTGAAARPLADNLPICRDTAARAWYAGEPLGAAAAAAAAEQTAADVRLCGHLAALLAGRMETNGQLAKVKFQRGKAGAGAAASKSWPLLAAWPQSIRDGAGAAVAAVVAWRNGALPSPLVTGGRNADTVAVVAWRALVASVKADGLGESVDLSSVSDSWLVASLDPLAVACVSGIETRDDKASRFLSERGAARRKAQLERRIEDLQAGQTARRRDLIERIGAAARRMIGGDTFVAAAAAVGFKADNSGNSAGSRLAAAARKAGFQFQFTLRQRGDDFAKPELAC